MSKIQAIWDAYRKKIRISTLKPPAATAPSEYEQTANGRQYSICARLREYRHCRNQRFDCTGCCAICLKFLPGANSTAVKTNSTAPQPPPGEGRDSPAAGKAPEVPPMVVAVTTPAQVFADLESQLKPFGV